MGQKSKLTRNRKFGSIRKELIRLYGEDTTKHITARAEKHYADCERLCRNASDGKRQHLDGTILPTVALCKALLEIDPENAPISAHAFMMNLREMGEADAGILRQRFCHLWQSARDQVCAHSDLGKRRKLL